MPEPGYADDLAKLQADFREADTRCEEISAALPSSMDIYEGAEVDWTELDAARAERMRILDELNTLRARAAGGS